MHPASFFPCYLVAVKHMEMGNSLHFLWRDAKKTCILLLSGDPAKIHAALKISRVAISFPLVLFQFLLFNLHGKEAISPLALKAAVRGFSLS